MFYSPVDAAVYFNQSLDDMPFAFEYGEYYEERIVPYFTYEGLQKDEKMTLLVGVRNEEKRVYRITIGGESIRLPIYSLQYNKEYTFDVTITNEADPKEIYKTYTGVLTFVGEEELPEIEITEIIYQDRSEIEQGRSAMTGRSEEREPNNTRSQANEIGDGDDVYGYIGNRSDVDYYKVKFDENGQANFWLDGKPPCANYDLYLYDEKGNRLKVSENGQGRQEQITWDVTGGKYYYIQIKSKFGYSTMTRYHLRTKNYPTTPGYEGMGWTYMYEDIGRYNYISSGYKMRPNHYGFDIVSNDSINYHIYGVPVRNVFNGKVVVSRKKTEGDGSGGNYVIVEANSVDPVTKKKLRVRYMHLKDTPIVMEGDIVMAGTLLGYTGNTGDVYPYPTPENPLAGTHLHFDVNKSGKNSGLQMNDVVNPESFFPNVNFLGDLSEYE